MIRLDEWKLIQKALTYYRDRQFTHPDPEVNEANWQRTQDVLRKVEQVVTAQEDFIYDLEADRRYEARRVQGEIDQERGVAPRRGRGRK